jgi:hypothetical protein
MKKPQLWILLGSCVWSWSRSKQASLQLFTLRISLSDQKEEAGALLLCNQHFASLRRRQVTRDLRLLMMKSNDALNPVLLCPNLVGSIPRHNNK